MASARAVPRAHERDAGQPALPDRHQHDHRPDHDAARPARPPGRHDRTVFRANSGESPSAEGGLLDGIGYFRLAANERIVFFTGVGGDLGGRGHLVAADLAGRKLLLTRDIYESYPMRPAGAPAKGVSGAVDAFGMVATTREFTDYQEYYAVDFDYLVGTVPERLIDHYGLRERGGLCILDIADIDPRSDFYVACTKQFLDHPAARLLFDEMQRVNEGRDAPVVSAAG